MLIPLDQLLVFALASLALLLIPGPAVLYIAVSRKGGQRAWQVCWVFSAVEWHTC